MTISVYTISLVFSAVVTSLISVFIWKYRTCRVSREFVLLLVAVSWWSATTAMETLVQPLYLKLFFTTICYLGSQFSPVLYLLFVLKFTQTDSHLNIKSRYLLFVIPCISFFMAATNGFHHLLWSSITLTESGFAGIYVIYKHGPWYWIEWLYSIGLLLVGIVVLVFTAFRSSHFFTVQSRIILLSSLIPIVGCFGYAVFFSELEGIDPTPLLFSLTGIFMAIGIIRYSFLDIVPIARDHVLECMAEGVLIIDNDNRIIDANPSAWKYLQRAKPAIGSSIQDIFPEWYARYSVDKRESGTLSISGENNNKFWLLWSISTINDIEECSIGSCLIIKDITQQYEANEKINAQTLHLENLTQDLINANRSLQLMTGITRHDILNMISVQRGYMEIAMKDKTVESYAHAVHMSYNASLEIQGLIKFTQEYQDIGAVQPSWMNLALLIQDQIRFFNNDNINLITFIPADIEILVEPLFAKVFYVLIENSLRHGQMLTEIMIYCRRENDLIIYYEDNGVGIRNEDKVKIFKTGFGKNTGLGLYLAKEILMVHDCSIIETGIPMSGVRFEITIPSNRWRKC